MAYREENGRFESRKELLKVAKLGPKAFEQCAGFMRITGGKNPLDGTSVHPESYEAVEKLFAKLNMKTEQISDGPTAFFIKDYKRWQRRSVSARLRCAISSKSCRSLAVTRVTRCRARSCAPTCSI